MLQDTHGIRVRRVYVRAKKVPLLIGLVESSQILRKDAHLDDLRHEVGEIRQGQVRLVQEPLLGVTLQVLEE
jgi:hypothetical protein